MTTETVHENPDPGATDPDVVLASAGDIPTLEALAAADILRQHLPAPVSFALKVAGSVRARVGKLKAAVGGKSPQRVGSL